MVGRPRPDQIANSLRRAVRERVLAPGELLNQDELARRFGVSRIPVREALRTLVGEGLIQMRPGLGAIVSELQASEVAELYGLRRELEPPLAPHVVANAQPRDLEDLASLVADMAALRPQQSEEWSSLNYAFHRRLYEIAGRRHALRLVVQVLNLVEPYARMHAHVLGARAAVHEQRTSILDAVRAADADRLSRLLTESIETAKIQLLAAMPSEAHARSPWLDPGDL